MPKELSIAKPLAPEDLAVGSHVAVLSIMTEHLTIAAICGDESPWQKRGLLRTRWLPVCDVGAPLRVVRICLPFVLVERADGKSETLDVRRVQVALLSDDFARKAIKKRPAE
jgi:hypothetical protein